MQRYSQLRVSPHESVPEGRCPHVGVPCLTVPCPPGDYEVSIKFNEEHIPDSPFIVPVASPSDDARRLTVTSLQVLGTPPVKPWGTPGLTDVPWIPRSLLGHSEPLLLIPSWDAQCVPPLGLLWHPGPSGATPPSLMAFLGPLLPPLCHP